MAQGGQEFGPSQNRGRFYTPAAFSAASLISLHHSASPVGLALRRTHTSAAHRKIRESFRRAHVNMLEVCFLAAQEFVVMAETSRSPFYTNIGKTGPVGQMSGFPDSYFFSARSQITDLTHPLGLNR